MDRRLTVVGLLTLLLTLTMAGTAYALTIVVDGDVADWPAGTSARIYAAAAPDANLAAEIDISEIYFTNDPTHAYIRIDNFAANDWDQVEYMALCLTTSAPQAVLGPCNSSYTLKLQPGVGSIELWNNSTGQPIGSADVSAGTTFGTATEIGLRLSDLGITAGTCSLGCSIGITVHTNVVTVFSGPTATGDDAACDFLTNVNCKNLPDSGVISASIGANSPTVVTVSELRATVSGLGDPGLTVLLGIGLLVIAIIGLTAVRRMHM